MLKNSIKKITLILFSILSISFIGINNVKAERKCPFISPLQTNQDDTFEGIETKACYYKGKDYDGDAAEVRIQFSVKTGRFAIYADADGTMNDFSNYGCLDDIINNKYQMSPDAKKNLNYTNMSCPKYAYYIAAFTTSEKICFDNGDNYCKNKDKNFKQQIKLKSSKTDTIIKKLKKEEILLSKESTMCYYKGKDYNAQIKYDADDETIYYETSNNDKYSGKFYQVFSPLYDGFGGMDNYISQKAIDDFKKGQCPHNLYLDFEGFNESCLESETEDDFCISKTDDTFEGDPMLELESENKDLIELFVGNSIGDKNKAEENCEGLLDVDLINWLQKIFNVIKIVAPLLVLGLTIFEFAKSVVTQDQDSLKKASNLFIKRLIIMAILFFLPTLINVILEMFEINSATCGIK